MVDIHLIPPKGEGMHNAHKVHPPPPKKKQKQQREKKRDPNIIARF